MMFRATQHCNADFCNIVWNGYNIVPTLQSCVALKIVVANRPMLHHLKKTTTIHDVTTTCA